MAVGREQDAISQCEYIENNHPLRKIKKQAEDLRYIFEAPKLEVSDAERVQIPLLQSDTWRKPDVRRGRMPSRLNKGKPKIKETYWDKAKWEIVPPQVKELKWYYQVLWATVLLAALVYGNMAAKH
mmetsp:Transcript_26007/g.77108  ORF Transcript_26007/g.77108 Transcript_26007/m.77108 type:complete len:126 (+) Transcript_26007:860-1237(+)